jgi:hypothetical protein
MKVKQKVLLVGGIAGALVGLIAAYLYIQSNETQIDAAEAGEGEMSKISPSEAMTLGLSLLGVLRLISNLGQ